MSGKDQGFRKGEVLSNSLYNFLFSPLKITLCSKGSAAAGVRHGWNANHFCSFPGEMLLVPLLLILEPVPFTYLLNAQ